MKIPFNEKWMLFEKEDYANYFFVYSTWEGYTVMPEKWGFENGRFMAAEFLDGACNLFMPLRYYDEMNRRNYRSLFTEPDKWDRLHKINYDASLNLFKFSKNIADKQVLDFSNKDAFEFLKEFFEIQNLVHVPRGPIWQLETPQNILNDYLIKYLTEQKEEVGSDIDISDAYRILTTPEEESILAKERKELAGIALIEDLNSRESKLLEHVKKYEWLEYGLQGRILTTVHFKEELDKILAENPREVLDRIKIEISSLVDRREKIFEKLKIGDSHKKIFKIVRDSLGVRLLSKYAQFYSYYALEALLKELGKRYGFTLEESRFLSIVDYENLLIKKKEGDYRELARRHKIHSVQISDKGETKIYTRKQAEDFMKKIKWHKEEIKFGITTEIVKGQAAFKGYAKGRVKIINTVQEIAKMHKGNILVSHMTNPDIVPAMKMAVAIVTDLGGITCHAAIVARELKTPCVIGTKNATRVLKDGDLVEVDANEGIVKIIR